MQYTYTILHYITFTLLGESEQVWGSRGTLEPAEDQNSADGILLWEGKYINCTNQLNPIGLSLSTLAGALHVPAIQPLCCRCCRSCLCCCWCWMLSLLSLFSFYVVFFVYF